ncbi:head-tail connector protein [Bradyrhizobium sp. CCH5-F6]|uniref:head-tail connector protein n=1 Tax=Bradyrhizobium sp. CCH5-F6 TaxID=1768753 RepID=UPI000769FB67|nr:head-tail connector protein [Bradyrhizobium sp. CCH5-F6]
MYRPVLVTPPAIKPITRTEAKAQLDISYSEKDPLIDGLIAAATAHLDGWTGILGRALCEQTWRQDYDAFCNRLRLPLFPVISVSSVKYTDTENVEQTVSSANYNVLTDDLGTYVEFVYNYAYPNTRQFMPAAVRVEYKAGYADLAGDPPTSSVPDAIKQAMLLLVRHWFDNPTAVIVGQTVAPLPFAVDALLSPYRRTRF